MAKRKNSTALFEVMRAAQQKALERQGVSMQGPAGTTSSLSSAGSSAASGPGPEPQQQPIAPPPEAAAPRQASKPAVASSPAALAKTYAPASGQSQLKPLGTPAIVTLTRRWVAALKERTARPAADTSEPAAPALDPDDPTAGVTAQSLMARGSRPAPVRSPAVDTAEEPNGEQVFVDRDEDDLPPAPVSRSVLATIPERPKLRAPGARRVNQVEVDRDRQEVTVKVRFQTVAIGVFATLAVVGLAYIAGKKTGTPARTTTTTEIRNGPVQPGVLDPRNARPGTPAGDANLAGGVIPGSASAGISPSPNGSTSVRPGDVAFFDSPVANAMARREPGLNYCVIESFSPAQQQWAMEVRDYLNSAGIACTIEIGRTNLSTRPGDYLIVGTRGFAPRYGNAPSYLAYEKAIDAAANSFPDKTKFRQPQKMMVKWVNE